MKLSSHFDRAWPFLHRSSNVDINQAVNEERFWDYYVQKWEKSEELNKAKYVGIEWQYSEEFIALLKKYASSEKEALEVGCGGGRVTATGVKLFKHVCAADLSEQMLRKCREALTESAISFHKLDGITLNGFADESLDFVYSHDVFVQLSSIQIFLYFIEFHRVLRKGGEGLVSCYDFIDRFELFKETSLRFRQHKMSPASRRLHFVTEETLRTMLSDVKFEILEVFKGRFLTIAFRK